MDGLGNKTQVGSGRTCHPSHLGGGGEGDQGRPAWETAQDLPRNESPKRAGGVAQGERAPSTARTRRACAPRQWAALGACRRVAWPSSVPPRGGKARWRKEGRSRGLPELGRSGPRPGPWLSQVLSPLVPGVGWCEIWGACWAWEVELAPAGREKAVSITPRTQSRT